MKPILSICTLFLFAITFSKAQDKIYKTSGEVLEAKVLEIGTTEIKYKTFTNQAGPTYTLPRNVVSKITYENGTTENFEQNAVSLNMPAAKRAQNVFVELGGQGLFFTANYDTRFGKARNGLGGRIGFGAIGVDNTNFVTVPVSLNYLLGEGKNFFEIGLGATYGKLSADEDSFFGSGDEIIGTLAFMYRYQPLTSGFSFRGGFTPVFSSDGFIPYFGGLSLGYTF